MHITIGKTFVKIGIFWIIFFVLLTCKTCGINIAWWIVFSPLWAPIAFIALVLTLGLICAFAVMVQDKIYKQQLNGKN